LFQQLEKRLISLNPKNWNFNMSRAWTQFIGTIGALANWGIPLAALTNIYNGRDPSFIDPKMTGTMCIYSLLFIRWSLAIKPANYPLFVCHISNELAQLTELSRWTNWKLQNKKTPIPPQPKTTGGH